MGRSIKKANQQFLSDRLKLSKISPEAAKYAGITALPIVSGFPTLILRES